MANLSIYIFAKIAMELTKCPKKFKVFHGQVFKLGNVRRDGGDSNPSETAYL